ncbi:MAG: efflux transporter outer membrane subunit [Phycisphaera sp.]|nr:MAG: efflux transporter outer membrane subunit [Phycisphaera sp.]
MTRRASIVLGLPTALALSGCAVGPDYEQPESSELVPKSWAGTDEADREPDLRHWWLRFGDDELTALIERSLASSLTLAEARERIIAARARRGIANAERVPQLDAQGSYMRTESGDEAQPFGQSPASTDGDLYSLGVVAGWELDLWGRVARLAEAADAEIGFATEDFRASRVVLIAEVAREVIAVRALDRDLAIVRATVETDRDALDIAAARAAAGFADELDVARARRDLEVNQALIPGLQADRRAAEFRLAVLLGAPAGTISVAERALPVGVAVPDRGVPADLLMRRPDLRRAERDLAAATARVGAAEAQRFPRVKLLGSITLQGPDAGDAINPEAYVLQAGPTISLPVFQGGRIDARVRQAESEQRQALLRLRATALEALAEVETASVRRAQAETRAHRFREAEAAARDAETLSQDRFSAGRVDFLDVTEARRARLFIERNVLNAQRDALLGLIDLYASLGGGWDAPEIGQTSSASGSGA